jgi:hypothetical protein
MTSGRYQLMRGLDRKGLFTAMRPNPHGSAEMKRRKLAREPNAQMSAILREAVLANLTPGRRG